MFFKAQTFLTSSFHFLNFIWNSNQLYKKNKKGFLHIIHTLNTGNTQFMRCVRFLPAAWSEKREIIPLQMYCIWMNEQMPGRSGATRMQIQRLIVLKIKMTNISRIPGPHQQHCQTQFNAQLSKLKLAGWSKICSVPHTKESKWKVTQSFFYEAECPDIN